MRFDRGGRMSRYWMVTALVLFAALPARAAIEIEPGTWQDTETGEENGKPAKAEVTTDCITPQEAKDPVKSLSVIKESGGQCQKLDVQQKGNVVYITMLCGNPREMQIDLTGSYTFLSSKHYTGTMKSTVTIAGKKTTANKVIDSKWISATCNKKQ